MVRFSVRTRDFSLLQTVHNVSVATKVSVQWVHVVLSPGLKSSERKFDYSLPSSVEVKNDWAYAVLPHHGLHGVHGENSAILKLCSQT
jgi:hypothetical protein